MKTIKGKQTMEPMKKKILEALKMQPLSEEEKQKRHILGRLYGPIATYNASTRNGRRYNKELWERALNDEIFLEKVANKSLFLELGHPLDREETDMEKICACIPEVPKIVNGDLYAYVDILDTNNGRLLKTLCDYGFVPGISSRGSGDVMSNDEVDPETFFLETWDIVQLPAVKDARLAMCESFNPKAADLKKALLESINKANKKDKKELKETLEKLNIKLTEEENIDNIPDSKIKEDENNVLTEETLDEPFEGTDDKLVLGEPEIAAEDTPDTQIDAAVEEPQDEVETLTVGDITKQLADFDAEKAVEFAPIIIDEKEYPVHSLNWNEDEDGKVVLNIGYDLPVEDNNITDEFEDTEDVAQATVPVEVIDDKAPEVIESVKELVRQKDLLEKQLNALKNDKAVCDAEVESLKEELGHYKNSFARVSVIAAEAKQAKKDVAKLNEQLKTKDAEIAALNTKVGSTLKLTESLNANANKVKILAEKLTKSQNEVEEVKTKLTEQATRFNQELERRTRLAKNYEGKFRLILNRYLESKASMLNVSVKEITSRLNEGYSLNDIDRVCDDLLNSNLNLNRLPFGITGKSNIQINESKIAKRETAENGYEIDDSLLELAGLK